MNDPHVRELLYRVEHSPFVSYEQPYEQELSEFRIRIEVDQSTVVPEKHLATVELKKHFARAEDARGVVEPFLRAWELDVGLRLDDPEALRFMYLRADIVDRDAPPGTIPAPSSLAVGAVFDAVAVRRFDHYPPPPSGMAIMPGSDVEAMFDKWSRYKANQAELADTANFCLTALEGMQKTKDRRGKSAKKFRISKRVLDRLGELAERGRKYKGYGRPYSGAESTWLEEVLKKIIRRAAEIAHDPDACRVMITMDDLPRT
jgi:hypothetical protein